MLVIVCICRSIVSLWFLRGAPAAFARRHGFGTGCSETTLWSACDCFAAAFWAPAHSAPTASLPHRRRDAYLVQASADGCDKAAR